MFIYPDRKPIDLLVTLKIMNGFYDKDQKTGGTSDEIEPVTHYRPQSKLREGNVFTAVCDSVHGGGGSLSKEASLSKGGLCPRVSVWGSLTRGSLSREGLCPGYLCRGSSLSGRPVCMVKSG